MQNFYNNLSETTKGWLLIAVGIVLLLNAMGLFRVIVANLIIIVAILMIVLGFMKTDLPARIKNLIHRK